MKIKEGGVMDLQKEREAFEKLPAVAELIKTNNVWWSDVHGDYFSSDHELDCWIDGAWAVWQAKAQAVPEGFVLVSAEQMSQWGHMANYAEQYGCPGCFEARGYAHNLGCEINAYFNVSEAQEQK